MRNRKKPSISFGANELRFREKAIYRTQRMQQLKDLAETAKKSVKYILGFLNSSNLKADTYIP